MEKEMVGFLWVHGSQMVDLVNYGMQELLVPYTWVCNSQSGKYYQVNIRIMPTQHSSLVFSFKRLRMHFFCAQDSLQSMINVMVTFCS